DGYLAAFLTGEHGPTGGAAEIGPRLRIRDYLFASGLPAPVTPAVGVAPRQLMTLAVRGPGGATVVADQVEPTAGERWSTEWCKGYLAGAFDADGGYVDGVLRIAVDPRARPR